MTPPRVLAAAGVSAGGNPGKGGSGSLPLIRPCGATFPRGERQGLLLAAAQASAGRRGRHPLRFAREWAAAGGRGEVGAPRPTDGDMETLWGLRGHPFPGRRAVGAGHARPGGLRGHPSMVRPVGRGLDPSAGCWRQRESPRGVGDAAPYGLPGNGRQREPAPHPALRGHLPPRGKARAVVGGGASLRGASGTPPPTGCPGAGGDGSLPLIRPCGATFPRGGRQGLYGGGARPPTTPAAGPRCGAGGSGCSTSGLTKPALYRRNPGRCRGGSRR